MNINKIISMRFQEVTGRNKMSIAEIAELSGYSASYLRRIRCGDETNPTIGAVVAIAETMGVNPYWLMGAPYSNKNLSKKKMITGKVTFVSDVVDQVSEAFDVHKRDILGPSRYEFILPARFALCKILRERGLSYTHIGKILSRDHSTAIHAIRRANDMMIRDKDYAGKIGELIDWATGKKEETVDG